MSLQIADRVKESTTTTGTGALTLGGAVTGYRAFSAICSTNDTCYYAIEAVDVNGNPSGDWETGLGTYSGASQLTRTTVQASSNAGSAVNFGAGTKNVWIDVTATQVGAFGNLLAANNLSDLASVTAARTNLGLGSAALFAASGFAAAVHGHAWTEISSTPTTLAGYGIADAYTQAQADGRYLQSANNLADVANVATARHSLGLDTGDSPTFSTISASTAFNFPSSGIVMQLRPAASGAGFNVYGNSTTGLFIRSSAVDFAADSLLRWTSGNGNPTTTLDLILQREAAGTLAQRNGANAQEWRLYNTFTDASNFERGGIAWLSNVMTIRTEGLGTGVQRSIRMSAAGVTFNISGSDRWQFTSAQLQPTSDNVQDIGQSGANRPRSMYAASVVKVAQAQATAAGGSASCALTIGTAEVGVYMGSGAPTVSAAKGSIYLRTDGSSTSTRLYVNTDGAATWTNFTSAA